MKYINDNIENGMVFGRNASDEKPEPLCKCCMCDAPIYAGDEYYNLCGDIICEECIANARCFAHAI